VRLVPACGDLGDQTLVVVKFLSGTKKVFLVLHRGMSAAMGLGPAFPVSPEQHTLLPPNARTIGAVAT